MLRISTIASAIAIGLAGTIINAASPLVEDDIVSNSMSLELTPQQVRCQPLDGSPLKFIHQDRQLIERDIQCGTGTKLYFAALGRAYTVTKHAAKQASLRRADLYKIAKSATTVKRMNGYIYISYGPWKVVIHHRNGTIVTVKPR